MAYQTLLVEIADRVGLIRLNRPEALNALNALTLDELATAIGAMDSDPEIGAIILTGSDKAFAAGADIKEMAGKDFASMYRDDDFTGPTEAIGRCRTPIIAAVAGWCLGGGCELAMMCDLILAADTARFGQPEINLGVIPGMGGTQRLIRQIGRSKAMDLCLTGRLMDAAEAERSGLAARIVPAADLLAEARAIATKSAISRKAETLLLSKWLWTTSGSATGITAVPGSALNTPPWAGINWLLLLITMLNSKW